MHVSQPHKPPYYQWRRCNGQGHVLDYGEAYYVIPRLSIGSNNKPNSLASLESNYTDHSTMLAISSGTKLDDKCNCILEKCVMSGGLTKLENWKISDLANYGETDQGTSRGMFKSIEENVVVYGQHRKMYQIK